MKWWERCRLPTLKNAGSHQNVLGDHTVDINLWGFRVTRVILCRMEYKSATTWFVVPRSVVKVNQKYIDEWQVVVSLANVGGQKRDNQIEIIDNHSAFGRSRVTLSSFKTEIEAKHFYDYMNTCISRFMFLMTDEALTSLEKKVPDLGKYDNHSLATFSKDPNERMHSLIGLSQDEISHVENKVSNLRH